MLAYLFIFFFLEILSAAEINDFLIINLKKRADKRAIVEKQFKFLNVSNYTFIDGFDGNTFFKEGVNITKLQAQTRLPGLKFRETNVRYYRGGHGGAHFGCLIGHMKALNHIVSKNISSPVLIMEDDFLADGNAFIKLNGDLEKLPKDWTVYYPGHCESTRTCRNFVDSERTICLAQAEVACAHSYVINGKDSALMLYNSANKENPALADLIFQHTSAKRYVRFPSLFAQYRSYFSIEADVKSEGGVWTKLQNETVANHVKPTKK